jgi:hypothetical protein
VLIGELWLFKIEADSASQERLLACAAAAAAGTGTHTTAAPSAAPSRGVSRPATAIAGAEAAAAAVAAARSMLAGVPADGGGGGGGGDSGPCKGGSAAAVAAWWAARWRRDLEGSVYDFFLGRWVVFGHTADVRACSVSRHRHHKHLSTNMRRQMTSLLPPGAHTHSHQTGLAAAWLPRRTAQRWLAPCARRRAAASERRCLVAAWACWSRLCRRQVRVGLWDW